MPGEQTQGLQEISDVGNNTTTAVLFRNTCTMKNDTAQIASGISDVTDGTGFATIHSFRQNGVEVFSAGTVLGFPGIVAPSTAIFFFGVSSASAYVLVNGATGELSLNTTGALQLNGGTGIYPSNSIYQVNGSAIQPVYSFVNSVQTGFYRSAADQIGVSIAGSALSTFGSTGIDLISGVYLAPTGSISNPSYSFRGDSDTGIYHPSDNVIGFSSNSSQIGSWDKTSLKVVVGTFEGPNGLATRPTYTFTSDGDSGFYLIGGDTVGVTLGSIERLRFTTAGFQTIAGSAGSPSWSFTGDPNTGLFNVSADILGLTTGGTERIRWGTTSMNFADAYNLVLGTTTGTKFGTATNQKIGFFNATPIIQPANTVAIDTLLVNLGLRASGGMSIFDTDIKANVVGKGLYVKEGTNATMGTATLVAGNVTVNTTKVTANSRIFLAHQNNSGTIGFVTVSARTAGTSFTITSSSVLDTSNIAWIIFEPA